MSKDIEGKFNLELNFPGDGRTFLNFWDHVYGNDVVAELKKGKLFWKNEQGEKEEITFDQYCQLVESSIKKRNGEQPRSH